MNYFELYDLEPGFFIDDSVLKKKFLERSRRFHPDHFALQDLGEQSAADELSAQNNLAYQTLKDPDNRLKYILKLHHQINDQETYQLDQQFLMDMLDLNDLMLEDEDAAKTQLVELEQTITSAILPVKQRYHFTSVTEEDLKLLKEYFFKKRYLKRVGNKAGDL